MANVRYYFTWKVPFDRLGLGMQRASQDLYAYDAKGRLMSYVPSGGSADVVAPTHHHPLITGGIRPPILNSPHLFTPVVSREKPPKERMKTLSSAIGYAAAPDALSDDGTEVIYGLTTAHPSIALTTPRNPDDSNRSNAYYFSSLVNKTTI